MAEVVTFVRIRMKGKPGTFVLASRDFDPALHAMADGSVPAPKISKAAGPPAGDITSVNVAGARALVEQAETVDELAAFEDAEKAGARRATVLASIDKRLSELGG